MAGRAAAEPGATIGILQGRLGNPSLDDRVKGMKETLGDKAKVVAEPATDCDQTKGLNAAQDILTANPDVTAIYGACGPADHRRAAGHQGRRQEAGRRSWWSASTPRPTRSRRSSPATQAGSVAQFPAKMGSLGIETAVAAARGQTVEPNVDTGTEMVTKENAAQFQ